MKEQIVYYSYTDKGDRAVNEDSLGGFLEDDYGAFVLCDGLGGHGSGDLASQLVVREMLGSLNCRITMEDSIMRAQDELLKKQAELHAENAMKTTVTCLTLNRGYARIGHVGDSRVYWFERNRIRQRTLDHSVPQALAIRGEIRESQIRYHEDRSRLLRVMGTRWDEPKYQIIDRIPLTKHSTFLMCSDGFWELVDERDMCRLLRKSASPQEWIERMTEVLLEQGRDKDKDNYSAQAIFVR